MRVATLIDVLDEEGCIVLGEALLLDTNVSGMGYDNRQTKGGRVTHLVIGAAVDGNDLLDTFNLRRLLGDGLYTAAGDEGVDGTAQFLRGGNSAQRARIELAIPLLEDRESRKQSPQRRG